MQTDLLKALIAQTACPFILEGAPCIQCTICGFFGIYVGSWQNYGFVFVSSYPLMDAFSMTYFIRDYRRAVIDKWKQTFSSASVESIDEFTPPKALYLAS
ncbi:unnamed protein product, partial [Mesorhabditis belari]|uniref:Uncharacterized protein n=1 Tax=Mesorhabditis belari TaxID=2138241 RepID=A0AAF3ELI1_9BILA